MKPRYGTFSYKNAESQLVRSATIFVHLNPAILLKMDVDQEAKLKIIHVKSGLFQKIVKIYGILKVLNTLKKCQRVFGV